jgi:hypothetical protein
MPLEVKMSTALDRIAANQKAMIPQRLVRGAEILGQLWRDKIRCGGEWGPICVCQNPNDFCTAKKRFLGLVLEFNDGKYPYDLAGHEGFLVLECMDSKMFEASGLTIVLELPPKRALMRIGRKGTCGQTILDLVAIPAGEERDAAIDAVVRLQQVF